MDRDVNAAINILKRGRAGLARTDAQGDICLYGAKGAASSVEELRTYPATAGEAPNL
jgi:transposase